MLIHAPKGRARIFNALINSHHTVNMACAPACWSGPHGSSGKCSSRRSSRGRCGRPTEKSAEVDPADSAHQGDGISTSRFHHNDDVLFARMLTFPILCTSSVVVAEQADLAVGTEVGVVCMPVVTHLQRNFDALNALQRKA